MIVSRRRMIAGAASLAALPAHAQTQAFDYRNHAAYRAWTDPPEGAGKAPLEAMLETGESQISLGDWMGGRPAIIALWATWCTPCLVEKAGEALMSKRLKAANARLQILIIQSYDEKPLNQARFLLKRLDGGDLANARATPEAEAAFSKHFGPARPGRDEPYMPSLMIADAEGNELARSVGVMSGPDRLKDYWYDDATFEFLSRF